VILLKYFVKIVYGSHLLEITSIVYTSTFPQTTTHLLPVTEALKPLLVLIYRVSWKRRSRKVSLRRRASQRQEGDVVLLLPVLPHESV
jgi:hypothetical protein